VTGIAAALLVSVRGDWDGPNRPTLEETLAPATAGLLFAPGVAALSGASASAGVPILLLRSEGSREGC
jgi:hypothetical protein